MASLGFLSAGFHQHRDRYHQSLLNPHLHMTQLRHPIKNIFIPLLNEGYSSQPKEKIKNMSGTVHEIALQKQQT